MNTSKTVALRIRAAVPHIDFKSRRKPLPLCQWGRLFLFMLKAQADHADNHKRKSKQPFVCNHMRTSLPGGTTFIPSCWRGLLYHPRHSSSIFYRPFWGGFFYPLRAAMAICSSLTISRAMRVTSASSRTVIPYRLTFMLPTPLPASACLA